jgi:competence protein ComEC
MNPHGFDYELWMREQGLQASAYVRDGAKSPAPQRLGSTWLHPVERARQQVRDAILAAVPQQRAAAGVVAALVTGDQNAIERADWDVFRATGVAHLMSISGLHITMFAWAATALVGWGWRRSARLCLWHPAPSAALWGGLMLAAAYALFSGWGLPAQRTVLMLATAVLLRLSGRRWPWPLVWLLACAVVVAVDPFALLQAGFWLSFVAVGVLFASGSAEPGAGDWRANGWQMLREQLTITLALAPLSLLLFGQVSVIGLVANLLAIPWVTLIVTPLAMAGVVVAPLWQAAAWGVEGMAVVLQGMAALPGATLQVAQPPLGMALMAVLAGVWLVLPLPWVHRALAVPLLFPVLLYQAPRPAEGQFSLLAADVGQGNAVIVQTRKHALVYDAGPRYSQESDAGHRVLVPLLRALNLRVDTLLLSHRDIDHTGGAAAVLAQQPQAQLLASLPETHELAQLRPLQACRAGQRWRWDGVDFEILHPQEPDPTGQRKSNAQSCVLRISNGQQTALLTGDIERDQEASLAAMANSAALRAQVLLVPHHGSKTSSSDAFLDAVQPRIALIQNGYRNRFGHPAAEVLERYEARQIRVFDSPHCGAAEWNSATPETVICERQRRKRYWHHRVP